MPNFLESVKALLSHLAASTGDETWSVRDIAPLLVGGIAKSYGDDEEGKQSILKALSDELDSILAGILSEEDAKLCAILKAELQTLTTIAPRPMSSLWSFPCRRRPKSVKKSTATTLTGDQRFRLHLCITEVVRERQAKTNDIRDLEALVASSENAIELMLSLPGHDPIELAGRYRRLGNAYLSRAQHPDFGRVPGDATAPEVSNPIRGLDEAISAFKTAAGIIVDQGEGVAVPQEISPPVLFTMIAACTNSKAQRMRSLHCIEEALKYARLANASVVKHEHLAWMRPDIYRLISDILDLRTALSAPPSSSSAIQVFPAGFGPETQLEDLEEAILCKRSVLQSTSYHPQPKFERMVQLAELLALKFHNALDDSCIEEACQLFKEAARLTPETHFKYAFHHAKAAEVWSTRWVFPGYTAGPGEFEAVVGMARKAADMGPTAFTLRILGQVLAYREVKEASGSARGLNEAILALERATELNALAPIPSLQPRILDNFALARRLLYTMNGDRWTLQQAIRDQEEAIALSPEGTAEHAGRVLALGDLVSRIPPSEIGATPTLATTDNDLVLQYRRIATSPSFSPSVRLLNAFSWVKFSALKHGSNSNEVPEDLTEAFDTLIGLLSIFAGLSKTEEQRHQALVQWSLARTPVDTAVGLAIWDGRYEKALEWLEQGRCLMWNQLNEIRAPVDELREHDPELAVRIESVSAAFEKLDTPSSSSVPSFSAHRLAFNDGDHQRARLANEWAELLEKVRSIPEFADFLRPRPAESILQSLPSYGHVVILTVDGEGRTNALVLSPPYDDDDESLSSDGTESDPRPHNIIRVRLREFSKARADLLARSLDVALSSIGARERGYESTEENVEVEEELERGLRPAHHVRSRKEEVLSVQEVLAELWFSVVSPILGELEIERSEEPSTKIWWCPTGPFTFLPIHAAGLYTDDDAEVSTFDYVVSSYIPTVSSLSAACASDPSSKALPGVLAITNAGGSYGRSAIPGTLKEAELIKGLADSHNIPYAVLDGENATPHKTLDLLASYQFAHFACHASQKRDRPLQSALYLHNGNLELSRVMKRNPRKEGALELAFLHACNTSTGDSALTDEAVHLAAGMLAAGYKGVVATMWSIQDEYAPEVAEEFYRCLMVECRDDDGLADDACGSKCK